jgi:hypothetical protein
MNDRELEIEDLKIEIQNLKNKIHYLVGSLESTSYLLNSKDDENVEKHLEHVKEMISRMIEEIKTDSIDFN